MFIFFTSEVNLILNNEKIRVAPNSCIIYTPHYSQNYSNHDVGFEHDWFHFEGDEIPQFLLTMKLPLNTIFKVTNYNFIRTFVKNLEKEFIGRDLFWKQNINGLFITNFVLLAREYQHSITHSNDPYKTDMLEKFKEARIDILTNYEKDWNTEQMAALVGLSRSRFSVLYKEFFGSTPKDDLIKERINKAKYLLSLNTMAVSSVAYSVGYDNIYHFNRQFKKIAGCSPGKYGETGI